MARYVDAIDVSALIEEAAQSRRAVVTTREADCRSSGARGRQVQALGLAVVAWLAAAPTPAHATQLARGDSAFARRGDGERDGVASPWPIGEAVTAYRSALDADPDGIEPRWKLLRALHFAGEFATRDDAEALATFAHGREVAEAGLDRLSRRLDFAGRLEQLDPDRIHERFAASNVTQQDVGRLYFWSAVHWGAWAQRAGLIRAVREGVANRIHRYVLVAIALDPEQEEGGPYRLLGTLHAQLPRVPLVAGWIDRERAVPLLERAAEIGPEHPGNQLLLAFALLDLAPEREQEARALLERVGAAAPREQMRVEDLVARREARERQALLDAGKRQSARTGGVT